MPSVRNDSEIKCFYCGRSGNLPREFYKNKSDEARNNKHIRHSRHFAGEGLNYDLKKLKLFMSNVAFSA